MSEPTYRHNKIPTPHAKELRKNMTPQEKNLWYGFFRTLKLEKFGLTVIRFSNREIDQEFRGVCESIDACIKQRVTNEA